MIGNGIGNIPLLFIPRQSNLTWPELSWIDAIQLLRLDRIWIAK
jgi:hypothetical protein